MCFNRRRNIFTLGDFHHTTNPVVARVRAQTKNRLQSDLFERDPFKVQSYNFYYAERPTLQQIPNHLHCNCNSSTSKPFDTYYYNHGFSNTRHDENSAQAGNFRGRKCSETQISKNNSTNVLCKQTSRCFNTSNSTNSPQIGTQRQQWRYSNTTATTNKSNSSNQQKLSAYLEGRQAARDNKSTNTSTTSLSSPQWQARYTNSNNSIHNNNSNSRERIPKWICRNEERILQTDATARAKQAARGTSKAMAAAVGTVGKANITTTTTITNNNNNNSNSTVTRNKIMEKTTTSTTTRRNSSGPLFSSSAPLNPIRCNVSSWRSSPTTENSKFSTRGSCSTTALEKKTFNNGASQTNALQQNGQKSGSCSSQQWRQAQQQRLSPIVGNVVNRNTPKNSQQQTKTVSSRCNSCQISIALKSLMPKQSKPENIVIKIESASPFKVVSNANNNCSNNAAKIRSKRLNNLMARKTTTNTPPTHSPNITSKVSSGTVEMNKCQLKNFTSEDDTLNQRRLNCERFFEREDERLRQRAATFVPCETKLNVAGHILGCDSASASREQLSKLVPCIAASKIVKPIVRTSSSNTSRNVDNSKNSAVTDNSGGSTSKRLENIYNRELTDLRQLRASIDAISCSSKKSSNSIRSISKPLNRTPSAVQRRLIAGSEPDHLSRISSNSTFTLPRRRNSFTQACRSVSQSSVRSQSSYQSEASNSMFLS